MDEGPCRSTFTPEYAGIFLVDAGVIEGAAHLCGQKGKRGAGAVNDGNGKGGGDGPPFLPLMKRSQAVGAHDPDEVNPRIAGSYMRQCIGGVRIAESLLESRDLYARVVDQLLAHGDAIAERREFSAAFQRVAGRHHPPELVEIQSAQGDLRDQKMPIMRRIERPAKEADHHATLDMRHIEISAI